MATYSDNSLSLLFPALVSTFSYISIYIYKYDKLMSALPLLSSSDQEKQALSNKGLFNLLESISLLLYYLLSSNIRNVYSHVLYLIRLFLLLSNYLINYLLVCVMYYCYYLCACTCAYYIDIL
jgi:hypothetical protein